MPATLTYPGVYIEEIPSGVRTITGVATSITAFIGRTLRGPVNEAITINNFGDFERIFGGLWVESPLGYAVRDFYLNGGSQAVIVRLYNSGSDEDEAETNGRSKLSFGDISLIAASPGAWGSNLRAEIDKEVSDEAAERVGLSKEDLFNLTVIDSRVGGTSEHFLAISTKPSSRRIKEVLEVESKLVRWNDTDSLDTDPPPTATAGTDPVTTAGTDPVTTAETDPVTTAEKSVAEAEDELKALRRELKVLGQITGDDRDEDAISAKQEEVEEQEESIDVEKAALDTVLSKVGGSDGNVLTESQFIFTGAQANKEGLYALEQLYAQGGLFNILCIPPYEQGGEIEFSLVSNATKYCEDRRTMLLVDPPKAWTDKETARKGFTDTDTLYPVPRSKNAALYYPRIMKPNPLRGNQMEEFVPCGVMAGLFARTDTTRGVWKAPAGIEAMLVGVPKLSVKLTDDENGELNQLGINCLRAFPVAGRVAWGARTLRGADQLADEWKYIPVRRTALFIEESLYRGTQWVVFEPNDEPLWGQIRLNVGAFMHSMFRKGAFQGTSKKEAYFIKCDNETTTQDDINKGIVNILVGFAPLKPAEFVVIKLQQMAGQIQT